MKDRQNKIINHLATSDVPLTAEQIAKLLGVSSRTVKSDMKILHGDLVKIGASLTAKRNVGYFLQIDDPDRFFSFLRKLKPVNYTNTLAFNHISSFLYIARKLVSSSKYVKIDTLAEELFTSRSSLRAPIKTTLEFLGSYNMITESMPGLGIRAYGLEHHARMAMMELYTYQSENYTQNNKGEIELSKWISFKEKELDDIRNIFIQTLISEGLAILDSYVRPLSLYFIIARRRYQEGYRIILSNSWIEEIKKYQVYQVAEHIYLELSNHYSGFDMPEVEIAFLAIWLLCNRDTNQVKVTREHFPTFYESAIKYADLLLDYVEKNHNVRLDQYNWVTGELRSILVPILAKIHFGLSGAKVIYSAYNKLVCESPLTLEITRSMINCLQAELGKKVVDAANIHNLNCLIYKILLLTEYDIKKRKLLIINSNGNGFGSINEYKLIKRFCSLIEDCRCVSLYEAKESLVEEFDAVLYDTSLYQGNPALLGTIHTILHGYELNKIYNSSLIQAYQYKQLLPETSIIQIIKNFDFISKEQFFQMISLKHCSIHGENMRLENFLQNYEKIATYYNNNLSVFLFGDMNLTKTEAIDIYFLQTPGFWDGNEIKYIVYLCLDWKNNLQRMKAMESCLCQLSIHTDYYQLFLTDKSTALDKLIHQTLKM